MEDLVAGIAQGSAAAEDEFARLFESRVRTMALMRTRDPETARDLAQEILMAAIEALRKGSLREPDRLAAFVLGIARNVINNYFRSRDPAALREPLDTDLISKGQIFDEDDERRQIVRQEIDLLDPLDRKILLLTLVDSAKPAEIALKLGISGDVVRQRKVRAVRRIAWRLSQTAATQPHTKRGDPFR